jgi:OCRE domain
MGYRVLDTQDYMRNKYGPRKGLEGPFNFSGRVLYYDPKEGSYYDPTTDFYVSRDEMDFLNNELMRKLERA